MLLEVLMQLPLRTYVPVEENRLTNFLESYSTLYVPTSSNFLATTTILEANDFVHSSK
jgi:hypothetical protein